MMAALKILENGRKVSPEDLRTLCKRGLLIEALQILHVMEQVVDSSTYDCLLQVCIKKKALSEGKLIHNHMNGRGFRPDINLQNTLVHMYAKCGSLVDCRRVFDEMRARNVFSWTVMIAAYVRHGFTEEALALFHEMKQTGIQPNQFTFASVLPACANLESLEQGMKIHEDIISSRCDSDVFVYTALINMYGKCGSIEKARDVFDKMPQRNAVSWTAMLTGYTQSGRVDEALKLFQNMPERNVVSWTAMIAGYVQNGQPAEALTLFRLMQLAGVKPNRNTFASVIPACAKLAALEQGMEIHDDITRSGFQSDVFVESALVDMYAKCGCIEKARDVFDKMLKRDVFSWTVMIAAYAKHGLYEEALKLFRQMRRTCVQPNQFTFASVLPACANSLEQGMEIHEEIIRCGFQSNVFVGNSLIDMYAKRGSIEKAHDVFYRMRQRDVVSWNTMIAAFTRHGFIGNRSKCFRINSIKTSNNK